MNSTATGGNENLHARYFLSVIHRTRVAWLLILLCIPLLYFNRHNRESKNPLAQTTKKSSTMLSKDFLRLVIVSDTHRSYNMPIPDGDVLIHAGDSEWSGSEMDRWASQLNHPHKLAICGNMDYNMQRTAEGMQNVTYLQDSSVTISGVKFYGSPWTPKFVGVFQLKSKHQTENVWSNIPTDVDVLITHGPPSTKLDITSRGLEVGDEVLLEAVTSIKPRVHCFGHIHESYGTTKTDDTLFCNAAVFNNHPPIVVDVPIRKDKAATVAT